VGKDIFWHTAIDEHPAMSARNYFQNHVAPFNRVYLKDQVHKAQLERQEYNNGNVDV